MFEPSDHQLDEATESAIRERAEEMLNTNIPALFFDMEDAGEYIEALYSAGPIGLVELQQKFRLRMAHEAMAIATLRITSSDVTRRAMEIHDGNECSMLEMRRA